MQKAKMVLPRMQTRKVWLGYYFNHYNAIVVYHTKPIIGTDEEDVYDTLDNSLKIAGCLGLEEFRELFPAADLTEIINPKTGYVRDVETKVLLEMKLTALWDGDKLKTIDFHLDGY